MCYCYELFEEIYKYLLQKEELDLTPLLTDTVKKIFNKNKTSINSLEKLSRYSYSIGFHIDIFIDYIDINNIKNLLQSNVVPFIRQDLKFEEIPLVYDESIFKEIADEFKYYLKEKQVNKEELTTRYIRKYMEELYDDVILKERYCYLMWSCQIKSYSYQLKKNSINPSYISFEDELKKIAEEYL